MIHERGFTHKFLDGIKQFVDMVVRSHMKDCLLRVHGLAVFNDTHVETLQL
ncbi:hypothetical protein D9M70_638050 [compost metagenome]